LTHGATSWPRSNRRGLSSQGRHHPRFAKLAALKLTP
jgi:hypothetical protein